MNVVSPLDVKLIWMKKKRPNKVIQAQASLLMLLRMVTCFSVRISQTISTCTLITMVTGSYPSHGGHIRDPMHKLPLPKVTAKTVAMPALTDMCCSFCCQWSALEERRRYCFWLCCLVCAIWVLTLSAVLQTLKCTISLKLIKMYRGTFKYYVILLGEVGGFAKWLHNYGTPCKRCPE